MTLYEMNQMGYASLPKMAKSEIETMKSKIRDWLVGMFMRSENDSSDYFLLLNNESHYYTVFNWCKGSVDDLLNEVFSIVKELGTLKSIEPTENNGAWEFWITGQDAVTRMYLLFDYTRGVIEV